MSDASSGEIGKTKRILVVEDNPMEARVMQHLLEQEGFKVLLAGDGRQGLEKARKQRPDLVIADIMMPKMDGFELCDELKNDIVLSDIPVLLLTWMSEPEDIIRELKSRADDCLAKPVDAKPLLAKVANLLERRRLGAERGEEGEEQALDVTFDGERYVITTGRARILRMLLSRHKSAVRQSRRFHRIKGQLEANTERLKRELAIREQLEEIVTRIKPRVDALVDGARKLADMSHNEWDEKHEKYLLEMLEIGEHVRKLVNRPVDGR